MRTPQKSPKANANCERVVGTLRCERLDFSAGAAGSGPDRTSGIDGDGVIKTVHAAKANGIQRVYLFSAFMDAIRDQSRLEELLEWIWLKHHNILSWYVRPLFILPYCYFAYQRSMLGLPFTLALLPTTLFWFPSPDYLSEQVKEYLAWEYNFLVQGVLWQQVLLAVVVTIFLYLLALAFWKRSILYGLVVLNAGTFCKVLWSVFLVAH